MGLMIVACSSISIVSMTVAFCMAVIAVMIMPISFCMFMSIVIMFFFCLMLLSICVNVCFSGDRFMCAFMYCAIGMNMTAARGIVPMRQLNKKRNGHQEANERKYSELFH